MEINWFTVIAQIVNFLILVYLLKRFLYKPVLKAIDEREKKIAAQLEEAAAIEAEAKENKELFRQKNEDFDRQRIAKMNEVNEQIDLEKERLFEEVRKESAELRLKFAESFRQQEQEIKDKLVKRTKDAVFSIAGKTLADLANAELEERIVTVFIEKIEKLDGEERSKFIEALQENDKPIIIKSVFELSATSKQKLEEAIKKFTERQNEYKYLLEPELVSGIEIMTKSFQMSWNIDSYLKSLKRKSIIKEKENAIH